jgi:hypothetical protein
MKKILDVPYYSEFDEIDGSTEHIELFKRRSCGIVSVKMAVDYITHSTGLGMISLNRLIKLSIKHKAYRLSIGGRRNYSGWSHSGIIKALSEAGFVAWRKRCFVLPSDIAHLKNEGIESDGIKRYKEQELGEFLETLAKSIDGGYPVIVSIEKNLGKKITPHLVVMTGYERKGSKIAGFYINDPNNPKSNNGNRPIHKDLYITCGQFVPMWRKTAIFIEPR